MAASTNSRFDTSGSITARRRRIGVGDTVVWPLFVHFIRAGRTAIAYAGVAIALLGIVNLLGLGWAKHGITSPDTQEDLLQILAATGAALGGVVGWWTRRDL